MIQIATYAGLTACLLVGAYGDDAQPAVAFETSSQPLICLAFSPGAETLATGGSDDRVKFWDPSTGRLRSALGGHRGEVIRLAFGPSGKELFSAGMDGTVRVWDTRTGQELRQFGPDWGTSAMALSPDGRTITKSSERGHVIVLCSSRSGEELKVFRGHADVVRSVAYSPDGQVLASASNDRTARIWDVATGEGLRVLRGHTAHVNAIAFAPDGKRVYTAGTDDSVRIWDVATGRELSHVRYEPRDETDAGCWSVAASPDGTTVAAGGIGRILLLEARTGRQLADLECGGTEGNAIMSIAYSADGKRMAAASLSGRVRVWDTKDLPRADRKRR